jgi:hypothetical protein
MCHANRPDCAEALVRAHCDTTAKDLTGRTGKQLAADEGHTAVVERLRKLVTESLSVSVSDGPPVTPPISPVKALPIGAAFSVGQAVAVYSNPRITAVAETLTGQHIGDRGTVLRHEGATGRFVVRLESGKTLALLAADLEPFFMDTTTGEVLPVGWTNSFPAANSANSAANPANPAKKVSNSFMTRLTAAGEAPAMKSFMHHPVYISLVVLYRTYTGARENDFTAGG